MQQTSMLGTLGSHQLKFQNTPKASYDSLLKVVLLAKGECLACVLTLEVLREKIS